MAYDRIPCPGRHQRLTGFQAAFRGRAAAVGTGAWDALETRIAGEPTPDRRRRRPAAAVGTAHTAGEHTGGEHAGGEQRAWDAVETLIAGAPIPNTRPRRPAA